MGTCVMLVDNYVLDEKKNNFDRFDLDEEIYIIDLRHFCGI